jgi:cobalt-zinc-cadmium efflux system outer membrane protein
MSFTPAIAQIPFASAPIIGSAQNAIPASQLTTRLSLQTATDLLIKNNLPVIAARYNVDILRAQRMTAGLRPNPTMTFTATQFAIPRVFQLPANAFKTNNENGAANTTYTLEVDQLIERGGKRELRSEQADHNTKAAEAQVQDALRQQLFQLRQAFFTAVLARENLRMAQENLNHFDRTENLLFVQVKEGYSAGVDLKRVQLQRLQFQRDVVTAGQGYQQAARDVLNLIGHGDAPSAANSTQLITWSSPSETGFPQDFIDGKLEIIPELLWIDDLRRMALANRPDIKAAEFGLEAANAGLKLAEAQRVRDVTIGGQYSRTGSDNTVGLVVGLPLKIGPRANAAFAQATSTKLQAEAQLRLVRTQALTDVEKAFTAYQVSRDRLRLFTGSALATANDVRRIEEIAYRDGAKGLLDYLDAQRTYNQTLIDYNQTRYDFILSLYQLELATGTAIIR